MFQEARFNLISTLLCLVQTLEFQVVRNPKPAVFTKSRDRHQWGWPLCPRALSHPASMPCAQGTCQRLDEGESNPCLPSKAAAVSLTGSSSTAVPATLFRRLVLTGVSLSCGRSSRFRMGLITLLGMEGDRKSWRHLLGFANPCWDEGETSFATALGAAPDLCTPDPQRQQ